MLMALYADINGKIYDATEYGAMGRTGCQHVELKLMDMIKLPEGAELMFLPGRSAIGMKNGQQLPIGSTQLAVAAMLPAGYTRTFLPAFEKQPDAAALPLYAYAAVALYNDELYVAAVKSDDNAKWHPVDYNTSDLKEKVAMVRTSLPHNSIVEHLAKCSLEWNCCTAQNLFYQRWEAGIPVSPQCNANCFGCISLQPSECCPSPKNRITFTPTPEEIADVGIYHLQTAPEAILSFGQGCEGEPSLAAEQIASAIEIIRAATECGVININTNAGFTEGIKKIVDAGIDSLRVSIISAQEDVYQAYYRSNYTLEDVKASIAYAKQHGVYVSLDILLFPGINDRPEEVAVWEAFIAETGIDMIQLRNLNVDPDSFMEIMPASDQEPCGVRYFINHLMDTFPKLVVGSFSRYLGE